MGSFDILEGLRSVWVRWMGGRYTYPASSRYSFFQAEKSVSGTSCGSVVRSSLKSGNGWLVEDEGSRPELVNSPYVARKARSC